MASAIGDLVIRVNSQTQGAERGIDRLRARQRGYRRETAQSSLATRAFQRALTSLVSVIGVTVLLRQTIQGVREELQLLDDLAKRSRGFGMMGRELYGLQFALKILGVEGRQTEKAIFRLLRNIGEVAALDTGEAKATFEALGLDPKELARLPVAEQLYRIMDALSQVKTQAVKAHHAGELFGRGAEKLITPLTEYKDTLRDLIEEGERYGGSLTEENLVRLQRFNDMMTRLGMTWRRGKQELAIFVTKLADLTAEVIRIDGVLSRSALLGAELGGGKEAFFGVAIGRVLRQYAGFWDKIRRESRGQPALPSDEELAGDSAAAEAATDAIARASETAAEMLAKYRRETERLGMRDAARRAAEFTDEINRQTAAMEKAGVSAEKILDFTIRMQTAFGKREEALAAQAAAERQQEEWQRQLRLTAARWRQLREEAASARAEAGRIAEGLETPAQTAMRQLEKLKAMQERYPKIFTPELVTGRAQQIYDDLREELKKEAVPEPALQFAGAAQRGTAEAYSAILQGMSAMQGRRDKTEQNTEDTARNTKDSAQTLEEIMREVRLMHEDQDEGMDIPGG